MFGFGAPISVLKNCNGYSDFRYGQYLKFSCISSCFLSDVIQTQQFFFRTYREGRCPLRNRTMHDKLRNRKGGKVNLIH